MENLQIIGKCYKLLRKYWKCYIFPAGGHFTKVMDHQIQESFQAKLVEAIAWATSADVANDFQTALSSSVAAS